MCIHIRVATIKISFFFLVELGYCNFDNETTKKFLFYFMHDVHSILWFEYLKMMIFFIKIRTFYQDNNVQQLYEAYLEEPISTIKHWWLFGKKN